MITLIGIGLIILVGLSISVGTALETSRQVHIASSVARDRRAIEEQMRHLEDLAKSARLEGVL